MKKIKCGLFCILFILVLSGCGDNEETTSHIPLTDSMIKDIESSIFDEFDTTKLNSMWEYRILGYANARVSVDSYDSKDVKEYTTLTVTSSEKIDAENYRVYGYFEGFDDFNNSISKQFYVDFFYNDKEGEQELESGNLTIKN